MTLKITLKNTTTLKHLWNHTENVYKDSNIIFSFMTLKVVKNVNPLSSQWKSTALLISFVLSIFSVTLVFQCDFQGFLLTLIPNKVPTINMPSVWLLWCHNDMRPHKNQEIWFLSKVYENWIWAKTFDQSRRLMQYQIVIIYCLQCLRTNRWMHW